MTDQVLTEDEKNALLDGVQSGEIEVHSSRGPTYASVAPFEIGPRSRIVKDSYPRLQLLNQQVADKLGKSTEQLLQCEIRVTPRDILVRSYGEFCGQLAGPSVVTIFEAPPLDGSALIVMEPGMVRHLVDTFFGGTGDDAEAATNEVFTPGELSVSKLFANIVLSTIKEIWAPLSEISPERVESEVTIDVVDVVAESDPVLCTEFEVSTAEKDDVFPDLVARRNDRATYPHIRRAESRSRSGQRQSVANGDKSSRYRRGHKPHRQCWSRDHEPGFTDRPFAGRRY